MHKVLLVVSVLAACSKGGGDKDPILGKTEVSEPARPRTIAYGDCAAPATPFESGPRPTQLPPWVVDGPKTADDSEPAESGGTGRAMALDEGKMGKPDKDPDPPGDPAQTARQQAIEAARAAGILGSTYQPADGAVLAAAGSGSGGVVNGGFGYGRAGFGPGGGASEGAIGTGRYGTIGHGAGSGYGIGPSRGTTVPTISIGTPATNGDLDKAIIRRYIKRNIQKIQYCYEKQLLSTPSIAGTVNVQFFIAPTGEVSTSTATGFDPTVAGCVASVIKGIEFPKPKGGGGVQVNYPFTFRPVDWSGTGKTDAVPLAPPPAPTKIPLPPAPPMPAYKPGATNPLAAQDAALRACVDKGPAAYGAIVVDLPTATVTGTDIDTAACIAAAAKLAAVAKPMRCGFAYGEMPASALPAVDITADAIRLNGKEVAKVAALQAQTAAAFTIDTLAAALPPPAAPPPALAMRTPFALRPVDAAPIGIVMRAAATLGDAGADFYFTAKRGAAWTPLRDPATFPQPPVPAGTGAMWGAARKARRDLGMPDDERVVLSLLVTKTSIWVGMSRINEFTEIKRDGADAGIAALAAKLAEAKQSAFFADRDDLEIGGESAVTWAEIVAVVDAAQKAGFDRWLLGEPEALAARPQL